MAQHSDRRGGSAPSARRVAERVLEITLLVTRLVAPEVRRLGPKHLSLSHMRALGFLDATPDAHLSTSSLVDGLARRGLVVRLATPPHDRRRLRLRLTGAGKGALRTGLAAARAALDARFGGLSPGERALIARAMARLRPLLTQRPARSGMPSS